MSSATITKIIDEDPNEKQVQENIAKWQCPNDPLAPLSDEQTNLLYEISDLVKATYFHEVINDHPIPSQQSESNLEKIQKINSNLEFIEWMTETEKQIQYEQLKPFYRYQHSLTTHLENYQKLMTLSQTTVNSINNLKEKYENVTKRTNNLHSVSEQLMLDQKQLQEKRDDINSRLKYFIYFQKCQEAIDHLAGEKINTKEFIELLETINGAIDYMTKHLNYKEATMYKIKYESLLNTSLMLTYNFIDNILMETTKQILSQDAHVKNENSSETATDSAFSLYYGKFQSASIKVKLILEHLEDKSNTNDYYKNLINDCQTCYFSQRLPMLEIAVVKALTDLKTNHKTDYNVLFRSCCLFIVKLSSDETACYHNFFKNDSTELYDYLGTLCQYLYDTLRPCLIHINHIEILCELCSILKSESSNEKLTSQDHLTKYMDIIKQLLEDVEERLVFRTNMFFKHDLLDYKPSAGDLAYPEKLQQMENVIVELKERRPDSRASNASLESQEVARINTTSQPAITYSRSYTGNSPADLHGMWYPTVKRTLVCLSRLYCCLERDTFQGLAQEALIICADTIDKAAELISRKKSPIDGKLFQIKHLLILREQIAPFQVDFTTKELSLNFSTVQKAAVDFLHKSKEIFSISRNNAVLKFILEGGSIVQECQIDSRKEIDKHLKNCCELFITAGTKYLVGGVMKWIEHVENFLQTVPEHADKIAKQPWSKPEFIADLMLKAQKQMKTVTPSIQRSMQLYLANKETEFILFRPIKNNVINVFIQAEQIIKTHYSEEDRLQIACPTAEQINILICSVSLATEQQQEPIIT